MKANRDLVFKEIKHSKSFLLNMLLTNNIQNTLTIPKGFQFDLLSGYLYKKKIYSLSDFIVH